MAQDADTASAALADPPRSSPRNQHRWLERARIRHADADGPDRLTLLGAAVITVLTWFLPAFAPNLPTGDYDYGLAVALAHHMGLDFGTQIATTYGPLYFLAIPSTEARGGILIGYLCWFVFVTGTLTAIYQALSRKLQPWQAWAFCAAIAVSFSIVPLTAVITATVGYSAVLSYLYAAGRLPRWAHAAFPYAMGILVASMVLTKSSVGAMCAPIALGAVLSSGHRRVRALLGYLASGLLGLLALWLLAGQRLGGLFAYLWTSASVGGGHAESMGLEVPGRQWEYLVVAIGGAAVAVGVWKLRTTGTRWPLLIGLTLGMWLMFKQGFVRHDGHSAQFFAVLFTLACLVAVARRSKGFVALAAVLLVVQAASFDDIQATGPNAVAKTKLNGSVWSIDPARNVQLFGGGLANALSGSTRAQTAALSRKALQSQNALPPEFVRAIGKGSVHAEPFDYALAWSYGLRPDILPTIVNYGAYTPELDDIDRKWIADDATAPQFIVRQQTTTALDSRFPLWDPPKTELEEICRYRPVKTSAKWELLRRGEDRCAAPRQLAGATVAAGQRIHVPKVSNGILVASVYPRRSLAGQAKATAFRAGELRITTDFGNHRLPWPHAGSPLVLDAPADSAATIGGKKISTSTFSMNAPGRVEFSVVPIR